MSKLVKKEERYDLHEDVIVKILCRLPVKSLIRFTCVSKRWRSIIISDPQFAKSHLQLASQQGTLSRKILIFMEGQILKPYKDGIPRPRLPSRFQSFQSLEGYHTVSNLTFPSEDKSPRVMAPSCNGLVLLSTYQRYCENLYIWNPSTAFLRNIPSPTLWFEGLKMTEQKKYKGYLCYGFGQVSATDDYKVVCVRPALDDFVDVYVFSLRANVWKVIKAPSSSSIEWYDRQGTLLNEAIHWINYHGVSDSTMVAFDLAKEEFRQVPLPVFNPNADGVHIRDIRIQGLVGGCLCVWSLNNFDRSEFWVMREYGVRESWVKHIQCSRNDLAAHVFASCSRWYPMFVTEDGTVMFKLLSEKELVWIKFCQEENPVCIARYKSEEYPGAIFDATLYDETLVSVPECL